MHDRRHRCRLGNGLSHMHNWFYRDAADRQLGPIDGEELAYLHRQGAIREDTLVWREGMTDWSTFAAAGHAAAAAIAPPRLPGSAVPAAVPQGAAAPATKPRLSGCAIAMLAALGIMLLIGLPAIGILAAIAIPAYQDVAVRSKIALASAATVPIQQAVDAWYDSHGQCPDADWLARQPAVHTATLARMAVGHAPAGHCTLELELTAIHADIDGTTLLLESTPDGWRCVGGSIPSRYLPATCKTDPGPATP